MMLTIENSVALIIVISLVIYVLTGGADFGGGVWDLFARGKRASAQRNLIANVLAPIWEANHIWLILIIVLLFVAFPKAYSTILTFLHFPATMMLFGIVLRGAAFIFRKYDESGNRLKKLWSLFFAIGSIVTPLFLGLILGAITIEQPSLENFFVVFSQPFPIFTGFFTLVICSYLAAVYLTLETANKDLQEDFRKRAIVSGIFLFVSSLFGIGLSYFSAGNLYYELVSSKYAVFLQTTMLISATGALFFLYIRKYQLARVGAVLQIIIILLGWMITQYPYLITGHISIAEAAAPNNILIATLITLGIGSLILTPSFIYLYMVFAGRNR
jgi:cytochrome bd ubiquinol oxidase subunit II